MAVHVGSVLADRYEVTAPIASGGMGEVWRGRDRTLGRTVAIKVLRSEYTGDSSFLIRFRNEARHTAALSHPNIASVYDYGESTIDGQRLAYLVMEYVEGKPLVTILAEHGRLTPAQTLDVLAQAGDGLSAAHAAGMVHRDIKPGNLLVRPDGMVKLTDFGIAYARDAAPLTRTGMVVGTAQYLSPEQAQGFVVTAASDVYSLGVLGYECVAGTRPFDGESQVAIALAQINRPPPPLPSDVPGPVRALIERALAKDPAARFPDGGAFAAAARQVAAGGAAPSTAATTLLAADGSATQTIPAQTGTVRMSPGTSPRTMPPLAGPPVDGSDAGGWTGEDWDDGTAAADRRRRLLWVVAGVLASLLVAGGAWALLAGGEDPSGGDTAASSVAPTVASTATASTNATGGIEFDVATYVGQDVDQVSDTLEELGLEVDPEEANADQLAAVNRSLGEDTVVTSDPARGTFDKGQQIVLYFTPDAYSPPGEPTDDGEPTTAAPPTTSAAPSDGAQSSAPGSTSTSSTSQSAGPTQTQTQPQTTQSKPAKPPESGPASGTPSTPTTPPTSESADAEQQGVVAEPSGTP